MKTDTTQKMLFCFFIILKMQRFNHPGQTVALILFCILLTFCLTKWQFTLNVAFFLQQLQFIWCYFYCWNKRVAPLVANLFIPFSINIIYNSAGYLWCYLRFLHHKWKFLNCVKHQRALLFGLDDLSMNPWNRFSFWPLRPENISPHPF